MNTDRPTEVSRPVLLLSLLCAALPGLFLLVTSTTHLVEGEFAYDVKRLLEVFLLTALLVVALATPALRRAFSRQLGRIPNWVRYALLSIVALGVISALVNARSPMHAAYSLLEVVLLSLLVLSALVIAACRTLAGALFDQVAITLLALTAIAVGIQELLGVAAALANQLEFYFRISLMHYSWPRFYNQVQSWILPVLATLPLVWSESRMEMPRSRMFQAVVCLLALGVCWYIILMTGGRGAALSLVLAFAIGLVFLRATRTLVIAWHLAGLAAGALIYLIVLQASQGGIRESVTDQVSQIPPSPQTQQANPRDFYERPEGTTRFARQSMAGRVSLDSSGRWSMWRASLEDIKAHPVLGAGPMNYACTGPDFRSGHPHNFPLQLAGEWGLPATVLLLVLVCYFALVLRRNQSARSNSSREIRLSSMLTVGILAAGIYSCLSGVMVMPASQVAGILICGWLLGIASKNARHSVVPSKSAVYVIGIAATLGICVSVFSYQEFQKRLAYEEIMPIIDWGIPRYWQHGKVCKYL